jgi:D-alanyl-D-alanine carboxypeptidase (penicillin-binding protein 5/6)
MSSIRTVLTTLLLSLVTFAASAATNLATPTPAPRPTPAPAPVPAAPQVSAKAYLLMDYHSGDVLAEKDGEGRIEPASITKLMSAYVVFNEIEAGRLKMDDMVRISKKAWRMEGSRTFLEVGTQVPVSTLIQGMIVQSGNDATVALAEHIAGSEQTFVDMMNQTAAKLGLTHTHFADVTGLPNPQHYTTARDIARLTRALITAYPEYYKYYSEKKFTYNGITQYNRNKLLWRDPTVDGVKTGHTDSAGYCLVASAKRDGMRLIAVVLGDRSEESRADSGQALLNYGFRFFETRELYRAGQPLRQVQIWKGTEETLPLGLTKDLYVTFPRGQYKHLRASANFNPEIIAPVQKNKQFGTLNVSLDTKVLAERPLVSLQAVDEGGWWRRLSDSVRLWFK